MLNRADESALYRASTAITTAPMRPGTAVTRARADEVEPGAYQLFLGLNNGKSELTLC